MKGWRTLILNIAVAVGGVLVAANWNDILPEKYAWSAAAIVGLVNIAMRYITTTPIGKASP